MDNLRFLDAHIEAKNSSSPVDQMNEVAAPWPLGPRPLGSSGPADTTCCGLLHADFTYVSVVFARNFTLTFPMHIPPTILGL